VNRQMNLILNNYLEEVISSVLKAGSMTIKKQNKTKKTMKNLELSAYCSMHCAGCKERKR
jgi:hypothetical protein